MKNLTPPLASLLLLAFIFPVFSQEQQPSGQSIIETIAESYADIADESTDLTPILEELERYLESPFNINTATREELERLHFLNNFQIENLLRYRREFGQIYSVYELQVIEGFNVQESDLLSAFVVFEPPETERRTYWRQNLNFRYGQNLEKAAAYKENDEGQTAYAGNPQNLLLRYRVEKGNKFSAGFTAQNNAGEEFFTGSNPYGFDFYSGFVGFGGKKIVRQVYLGDYHVRIGQGLTLWSGFGKRKSSEGINIRPTGQGLRPYTSTDENNFLRGVASHLSWNKFNLIVYYSNLNVDATVAETDDEGNPLRVSALQSSGYHRTASEIANKRSLNVQTVGTSLRFTHNRLAIGLNGTYRLFGAEVQPSGQLYNMHNFRGDENYNLSADAVWFFNRINFFGEAAISQSGGTALIAGMESQPANEVSISMIYRDYAHNYHSISGTAFGEWSGVRNERGLYTGISLYPFPKFKFSGYVDAYESHWLRFNSSGPVRGTDYMLQSDYSPLSYLDFYVRVKYETNSERSSERLPIRQDTDRTVSRVRLHASWEKSSTIGFRFRAEWSGYQKEETVDTGWLLFADVLTQPTPKLRAIARLAWFNTDSYNSRIYAYENDVLQYFYIPAFYSQGLRYYLNMNYEIASNLKVYLKLGQSVYLNEDFTIGSGHTAIEGNKRTDLRVHLRYRF